MIRKYTPTVLALFCFFAIWQAAVILWNVPHYILPRPTRIAAALWANKAVLATHFGITLEESVIGLLCSVVVGVASALLIFFSKLAERVLYPIVIATQTIPLIAISPIVVMWFGYALGSKVAVVILYTFFPVTVNTLSGLRSADAEQVQMMRTLGATRWSLFCKLELPGALPSFFTGLKLAATFSVGGAAIGEWLGSEAGLGMYTKRSSGMLKADNVFAGVILLSVMGILLFLAAKALEHRFTRWHKQSQIDTK